MKLSNLASKTRQYNSPAASERLAHVAESGVRRVEFVESVDSDRQRSLRQELNEFEQAAIGAFHGQERLLQEARDLAAQIVAGESELKSLLRTQGLSNRLLGVDDNA